jgi:hypothetical protein
MLHLLVTNFAMGVGQTIITSKTKKKERKKGTPPWYEIVGRHPKDLVSHGL